MSVDAIAKCPFCSSQLRIPGDRGKLVVNCPKCQHRFDVDPVDVLSDNNLIRLLKDGAIGKQFQLVLKCYDEQNRDPLTRQKVLTAACPAMLELLNYRDRYLALLTDGTHVI